MHAYAVTHRPTGETYTVPADSAREACARMRWALGDCETHVLTCASPEAIVRAWVSLLAYDAAHPEGPEGTCGPTLNEL